MFTNNKHHSREHSDEAYAACNARRQSILTLHNHLNGGPPPESPK